MYQRCVVVFCVFTSVCASWLDELKNDQGMELGNGVTLRIDQLNRQNASIFERHALRLNYRRFGISIEKALNTDALQVGLYVKDNIEGRGKKVDQITIPVVIGFKITAIAAMFFVTVGVLVLKALALSKLSAAVAAGILLTKFFTLKSSNKNVELEQSSHLYYPSFYEDPSAMSYNINNISPYYTYPDSDLKNLHRSESKGQYNVVETTENDSNSTDASDRVDNRKKQFLYSLPLRKYTYYR